MSGSPHPSRLARILSFGRYLACLATALFLISPDEGHAQECTTNAQYGQTGCLAYGIDAQTFQVGVPVSIDLPRILQRSDVDFDLWGGGAQLPAGLSVTTTNRGGRLQGTPSAVYSETTWSWEAVVAGPSTLIHRLTFTMTVVEAKTDEMLAFSALPSGTNAEFRQDGQATKLVLPVGQAFSITLPRRSGDDGASGYLPYAVVPQHLLPSGVSWDGRERSLSGTVPPGYQGTTSFRYQANPPDSGTDGSDDPVTLITFQIELGGGGPPALVRNFKRNRAAALISSQPNLARLLKAGLENDEEEEKTVLNFAMSSDGIDKMDGRFELNGVWGELALSRYESESAKNDYAFAAFGADAQMFGNALAGVMLQLDKSEEKETVGTNPASVDGTGWLIGPYFVARHATQPLYFDGRLLYGQTDNDVTMGNTGSFDTERWFAQFQVEGELSLDGEGRKAFPYARLSWFNESSDEFELTQTVSGQKGSIAELTLGANLEVPVAVEQGAMTLTGGLGVTLSQGDGDFQNHDNVDDPRGQIELGLNYRPSNQVNVVLNGFYDGIGASGFKGYGLTLGARMDF